MIAGTHPTPVRPERRLLPVPCIDSVDILLSLLVDDLSRGHTPFFIVACLGWAGVEPGDFAGRPEEEQGLPGFPVGALLRGVRSAG